MRRGGGDARLPPHSIAWVMIGTPVAGGQPVRPGGSGTNFRGWISLGEVLQHSRREQSSLRAPCLRPLRCSLVVWPEHTSATW